MGTPEVALISLVCIGLFVVVLVLASAIRLVPENQRLSVFRLGRYVGEVGPGLVFLWPFLDRGVKKDVGDQLTQLEADEQIWGAVGKTKTVVHNEGEVELSGSLWQAISDEPIPVGENVRVKRVILEVERM